MRLYHPPAAPLLSVCLHLLEYFRCHVESLIFSKSEDTEDNVSEFGAELVGRCSPAAFVGGSREGFDDLEELRLEFWVVAEFCGDLSNFGSEEGCRLAVIFGGTFA